MAKRRDLRTKRRSPLSRDRVLRTAISHADATIGCLREAGFSYPMADHAAYAIESHIYGFTLQKLNFPLEPREYAQAAKAFMRRFPESDYPYLHGMSRQVINGRYDGLRHVEFGLELILDGLEQLRSMGATGT